MKCFIWHKVYASNWYLWYSSIEDHDQWNVWVKIFQLYESQRTQTVQSVKISSGKKKKGMDQANHRIRHHDKSKVCNSAFTFPSAQSVIVSTWKKIKITHLHRPLDTPGVHSLFLTCHQRHRVSHLCRHRRRCEHPRILTRNSIQRFRGRSPLCVIIMARWSLVPCHCAPPPGCNTSWM